MTVLCVYMILALHLEERTPESYKLEVGLFCSKNWTFQIHIIEYLHS